MLINSQIKQTLRCAMRTKRKALSTSEQATAAQAVLNILSQLPAFIQAKNLAGYVAIDGEIDLSPVFNLAITYGKKCYIPQVNSNPAIKKLLFSPLESNNRPQYLKEIQELDLVLAPLVAFDRSGNRLGMGGGYFDATLKELSSLTTKPKLIGVAYAFQEVAKIPIDSWDLPLEAIVTNNSFIEI